MIDQLTLNDVVVDAAKEVFETMIFMDIETSTECGPVFTGQSIFASITFKGSLEGRLTIHVAQESARLIAQNMLGMDDGEEMPVDDICDAIGEVSNMVLGSIKTRLQDRYTDIEVSIPSVIIGREIKNTCGDQVQQTAVCVHLNGDNTAEFMLIYREGQKD